MNEEAYKKIANILEENNVETAEIKLKLFNREKYPNDEYIQVNYHNPKAFLFPHSGSIRLWATKHKKTEERFIMEQLNNN